MDAAISGAALKESSISFSFSGSVSFSVRALASCRFHYLRTRFEKTMKMFFRLIARFFENRFKTPLENIDYEKNRRSKSVSRQGTY
jgi:hypothetical protein